MIMSEKSTVNVITEMQRKYITESGESADNLVGSKTWLVYIMNNYYDGRYYDYHARPYRVVAGSAEEAKQTVLENADLVLKDLMSERRNGRRLLSKKYALPVTEKNIGIVKDGTTSLQLSTTTFRNLLSPRGFVSVTTERGIVTQVEDVSPSL